MRAAALVVILVLVGCADPAGGELPPDCVQSAAYAEPCEDDTAEDEWARYVDACEDLAARARRADCQEELGELLACIEETGACL